jgi:hypothetical protein
MYTYVVHKVCLYISWIFIINKYIMEGIGLKVYLESLGFVSEDEEGNDSQNLETRKEIILIFKCIE